MTFQQTNNGRITVVEFGSINTARELVQEMFTYDEKACEFIELRKHKGFVAFTIKDKRRNIMFQLKQIR